MRAKDLLGHEGERLAEAHLSAQGMSVVERNWRSRSGEIDLIALDGSALVFCEVKARSSTRFGSPAEAVTPVKAARIRRLAAEWLSLRREEGRFWAEIRFDVVTVLQVPGSEPSVEHLPGAF